MLQELAKQGSDALSHLFSHPSDHESETIARKAAAKIIASKLAGEALHYETLGYMIDCLADFIQNILQLRPGPAHLDWFFNRLKINFRYLDDMAKALDEKKRDDFNDIAHRAITINIDFESLELALILERHALRVLRDFREGVTNAAFYYSALDVLSRYIPRCKKELSWIPDRIVWLLLELKNRSSQPLELCAEQLVPKAIEVFDPLARNADAVSECLQIIQALPKEERTPPSGPWWIKRFLQAEMDETHRFVKQLLEGKSLTDREWVLSDAFTLFNAFKRRYEDKKNTIYVAFSSMARASMLAKNTSFLIPEEQHSEIINALIAMVSGLILLLETLYQGESDKECEAKREKASHMMKESFSSILSKVENARQSRQ